LVPQNKGNAFKRENIFLSRILLRGVNEYLTIITIIIEIKLKSLLRQTLPRCCFLTTKAYGRHEDDEWRCCVS